MVSATESAAGLPSMSGRPAAFETRDLEKVFRRAGGEVVRAVSGVSLRVEPAQLVAIVGPSGAGKSTLLRCLAGLERPTAGDIFVGGALVSSARQGVFIPPERRGVGMMFQSYALWPHMTVAENVAFPLQSRRLRRSVIKEQVAAVLERVGLAELAREHPGRLSGGQQQRVALARSLVAAPQVILFDEPLSNVDAKIREELRLELVTMQRSLGFAGLYVTHDQDDALQLCHRLIVLREGGIEQVGAPDEVYRRPRSSYVAEFVGSSNRLDGIVTDWSTGARVRVETPLGIVHAAVDEDAPVGSGRVALLTRPHAVQLVNGNDGASPNTWSGTVQARMFMGSRIQYVVALHDQLIRVLSLDDRYGEGDAVSIMISPEDILVRAID
jgi:iron(III) transport system ATP-binding protein